MEPSVLVRLNPSFETAASSTSAIKAQQSAKIRDIRQALMKLGFVTLDKQARVLELSRSTPGR